MKNRMRVLVLTSEDRAIFARLPIGTEFAYRFADSSDFATTSAALLNGGCVFAVARAVHLGDAQRMLA